MGYGMDEGWEDLADEQAAYERGQAYYDKLHRAEKLYKIAKDAETGCTIKCPWCEKLIVKKTYHKIFCSNQKTHGKNNCKDKYWNNTQDQKRQNGQLLSKGVKPGSKMAWKMLEEIQIQKEIDEQS